MRVPQNVKSGTEGISIKIFNLNSHEKEWWNLTSKFNLWGFRDNPFGWNFCSDIEL